MIVRLYNLGDKIDDEIHLGNWDKVRIESGKLISPSGYEEAQWHPEKKAWYFWANGNTYDTMEIQ